MRRMRGCRGVALTGAGALGAVRIHDRIRIRVRVVATRRNRM